MKHDTRFSTQFTRRFHPIAGAFACTSTPIAALTFAQYRAGHQSSQQGIEHGHGAGFVEDVSGADRGA
jgi:hypothetical protein